MATAAEPLWRVGAVGHQHPRLAGGPRGTNLSDLDDRRCHGASGVATRAAAARKWRGHGKGAPCHAQASLPTNAGPPAKRVFESSRARWPLPLSGAIQRMLDQGIGICEPSYDPFQAARASKLTRGICCGSVGVQRAGSRPAATSSAFQSTRLGSGSHGIQLRRDRGEIQEPPLRIKLWTEGGRGLAWLPREPLRKISPGKRRRCRTT